MSRYVKMGSNGVQRVVCLLPPERIFHCFSLGPAKFHWPGLSVSPSMNS